MSIGGTRTGFNVNSDTSLSVYIPAGESPGTVDIRVTSIGGTSTRTSADRYTYLPPPPPPTVTGVSPNSGTALGGTTVTITGTGFTNAAYVSFGGYAAQSFTVNSDTSITAVTPATYYDGAVDVTVQSSSGWSATSAGGPVHLRRRGAHRDRRLAEHRLGRRRRHGDDHRHRLHDRLRCFVRRRERVVHGQQRRLDHRNYPGRER